MKAKNIASLIESLKQQLVAKYHPEKIILFGSAAREADEINDVDFFLVKDDVPVLGAERIYRPSEVAERLALGDPFVTSVFREGKVLYG